MRDTATLELLAERFRRFARDECRGASRLYQRLAAAVADDPALLGLATAARPGQPAPNALLAAVHYLLLSGAAAPLAAFYPSLTATPDRTGDPYPAFRAFCLAHADAVRQLLATRRVQTNEVGRCACLLPAFTMAAEAGGRPLALLEIGASAGLNLLWDRFGYDYGDGRRHGRADSPVQVTCALRGVRRPPLPESLPSVSWRLGVDLAPVDVRDPDAARWLQALVWPEHRERAARLAAALDLARGDPPAVVAGEGVARLPELAAAAPREATLCVVHTFTLNQLDPEARAALGRTLRELGVRRPVVRVSIEWVGGGHARLALAWCGDEEPAERLLARCAGHGGWMEWLAEAGA